MLSDLSCSALPFDIPTSPDLITPCPQEDTLAPLNFDDLLDIAREFEFTRTITHIWPCEEEPSSSETQLDDILAAIASTPNTEECQCPIPLSGPISSATVHPVDVSKCPVSEGSAYIPTDSVPLPKGDDQVQAKMNPIASILQGWSPSNGSEFLDLDDNLMFPQPAKDTWNSFLPTLLPVPSSWQAGDVNQSFATVSAVSDVQLQTSTTAPKYRPSTTDESNDVKKKNAPTPRRNILETVQIGSAVQPISKVTNQPGVSQTRTSKPRPTPLACGTSSANYTRAPRGGIPPHVARLVTRANILRIEKERKVVQDTFSNTSTGQGKKPSVLRKPFTADMEAGKNVNCSGSRKESFDWDENGDKQGRTAKRVKM